MKNSPESHLRNSSSSLRLLSRNNSTIPKWFLKRVLRFGKWPCFSVGYAPWAWKLHSGSGRSKNRSKSFGIGPARSQFIGLGERRANLPACWAMAGKPIRQSCTLPEHGLHQVGTRDRVASNQRVHFDEDLSGGVARFKPRKKK